MEFAAGQTQQMALRNWLGRWQAALGDKYSGALGSIDIVHLMIHAGRFFSTTDVDQSVDIASPKEYLIITPDVDDMEFHCDFGFYVSSGALAELFEGAEVSDNGTEITPVNHHRTSTYESVLAAYADPTVTSDGDLIEVGGVGSGGGGIQLGGRAKGGAEWDIKPNTVYLLRVTVTANGSTVAFDHEHYEFDENELTWEDGSSSSA